VSIRKHGNRWQVRLRVGGGQRIERTLPPGASRRDALQLEAALRRAQIDLAIGRPQRYLIDDALDRWVEASAKALRSWDKDLRYRVDILRDYTAQKPLEALPDVADHLKRQGIAAGLQPATINRALSILRRIGNLAEKWGWTREPLGRRIELLPGERPREAYLTAEQVNRLIAAAEPVTADFMAFAALTGLRRSEILRLTPADIRDGAIVVSNESKSGRSRIVPMPDKAARIARRRLPFTISVPLLRKRFVQAREAAGLPHVRLHDLRHAFGTWLGESGAAAQDIRDLMGHSSLAVTSRYLQSVQERHRKAIQRLPKVGTRRGTGDKAAAKKAA
jgi:integrase